MGKIHLRRIIICALIGLVCALLAIKLTPPVYEANIEVLVSSEDVRQMGATTDALERIIKVGNPGSTATETQLLRGGSVFQIALTNVASRLGRPELLTQIERLYEMYDVSAEPESRFLRIQVRAYDQRTALELANEIPIVYNELRSRKVKEASTGASQFLASQMTATSAALKTAEDKLDNFKRANNISDPGRRNTQDLILESSYRQQLSTLEAAQRAADAEVTEFRRQLAETPRTISDDSSTAKSSAVLSLESQINALESQRTQLLTQYTPRNPEVVQIDRSLRELRSKLNVARSKGFEPQNAGTRTNPSYLQVQQSLLASEARQKSLAAQAKRVQADLAGVQRSIAQSPAVEATLVKLQRESDIIAQQYARIRSQSEAQKTQPLDISSQAQIFAAATSQEDPVAPAPAKYIVIGIFAGLCLGVVYTITLESMRPRVYSSSQIGELTGLSVAATVPRLPAGGARRKLQSLIQGGARPMEGFRFMAFASMNTHGRASRVVLFTSGAPGVSSSLPAAEYALALAQSGVQVLLVDANFDRQHLTSVFNGAGKTGLSDVLSSGALPSETPIAMPGSHPNLSFMPAGAQKSAALADYQADRITGFLNSLRTGDTTVVVDVPPCSETADATAAVGAADEVFLVVSAARTSYQQVATSYSILSTAGAKEVMLILTDASVDEEAFARNDARDVVVRA